MPTGTKQGPFVQFQTIEKDTALVSRTVLHGFLSEGREDVNIVNCPAIAKELGLELIESTINATTEYSELIVVELNKGGEKFRLAGTIIGKSPRIVEINKLYVDTNITGNFLIVKNDDRPGIVGLIGTSLAESKLNIANLSLARNKSEGNALTVIELDSPATQEIIDTLGAAAGVISVKALEI